MGGGLSLKNTERKKMILFKQMTVIGVGLIGGSLALAAKRAGIVENVVGYSKRRGDLYKAISMGVLDRYFLTLPKAVETADLVVFSTPVGMFESLAKAIVPYLKKGAVVTDVGSVKGDMVFKIEARFPDHVTFVGGHPMVGREKSGVSSALPKFFDQSITILTPTPKTDTKVLRRVANLWKGVGASVVEMDPHQHDRVMAFVSHLPHFLAFALMDMFNDSRVPAHALTRSAGGLRDATRIAESSPEMWHDIFRLNKVALFEAIDCYQETLENLKKAITTARPREEGAHAPREGDALLKILMRAKALREKLS